MREKSVKRPLPAAPELSGLPPSWSLRNVAAGAPTSRSRQSRGSAHSQSLHRSITVFHSLCQGSITLFHLIYHRQINNSFPFILPQTDENRYLSIYFTIDSYFVQKILLINAVHKLHSICVAILSLHHKLHLPIYWTLTVHKLYISIHLTTDSFTLTKAFYPHIYSIYLNCIYLFDRNITLNEPELVLKTHFHLLCLDRCWRGKSSCKIHGAQHNLCTLKRH